MDSPDSLYIMPKLTSTDIPDSPSKSPDKDLSTLKSDWTTLYKQTLPSLARSKAPSQPQWPVHLDHCFARIILDAVIGNSTSTNPTAATPSPWTERIASPAIQHMTAQQLKDCITLGEAIADGKSNLAELDQQSLTVRGKSKGQVQPQSQKRKTAPHSSTPPSSKKPKPPPNPKAQPDIRTALGLPTPTPTPSTTSPAPPPPPAIIPATLSSKIRLSPSLTPFRRLVLLSLCQVPRGSFTTYLALSKHLSSSPRAVGNALRNNPFAPQVPCHRVVAADLSIGGFGGEWGVKGKHYGEKVRLLRGEGVEVLEKEGRVRGVVWEGFV